MKMIIKLTLLAIFVLSCSGCVTYVGYDGPYEGQIIDMDTRQPLEGVVVQGGWSRVHLMGGHSDVDFKEVLTDKNGNFKVSGVGILIFSDIEEMDFCALKAGYSQVGYCYGPWSHLKHYSNEVEWKNDKPIIKLKHLTFEERRKRSLDFRGPGILSKNKLSWLEYNRELFETCRDQGENRLFPMGAERIIVSPELESFCKELRNKEYNESRTLIPMVGKPPSKKFMRSNKPSN